jgi:ATP-binding cassette subfamily F protein 3
VLDEMKECGSQKTELELRTLLGCFLFSGDEVEKKIRVLSGGEKARVALAKTIISKANFLLLDEPTNHLDMHSSDLLVEALNRYEGSYILVSHDRFFISKTANKIWEIVDHKIKEFKGGYDEYAEWKERMNRPLARKDSSKESSRTLGVAGSRQLAAESQKSKNKTQEAGNDQKGSVRSASKSVQSVVKKELQKQQRIFQQLEEKIADLNKKKQQLENALADPATYSDKNKFLQTETDYKKVCDEFAIQNSEYEKVFEKIMELEDQ